MRTIAYLALLLLLSFDCSAANPSDTHDPRREVTVDYLYESCSAVGETAHGDIPYFDCQSYVYGVLDSYVKVRERIPKSRRSCFPDKIEPWRVLEMANPKTNSYSGSQTAASFLIDFLVKRYPCV
jgi:Rap1a immunity proteins